jgi:molybdate transport system permease protein
MAARLSMALVIAVLLAFLAVPLISMFVYTNPGTLLSQLDSQVAYQAVVLSLVTSVIALVVTVILGTPVAYWLAKNEFRGKPVIDIVLQLTIVMPASVAGVGLLLVFGKTGILGHVLARWGVQIPFTQLAVVLAQVFTAAAFYISSARQAFVGVDDHLIAASRTLGVPPWRTFLRVTVPLAAPGMMAGAALGWARALGEFGATLVFAGNLPGATQTLPLAIYTALQANLTTAVAISALLLVVAAVLLVLVKFAERRLTVTSRTGITGA